MLIFDLIARPVLAQVDILTKVGLTVIGVTKFTTPADLVSLFLKLSLWLAGFLAFVGAIYAGIRLLSSGDADPKSWEASKQMLTNAIIGFILVISAVAIVKVIETITGIQIIS